jgi:HTH-type transcriptional regulator/antitoxin HipB
LTGGPGPAMIGLIRANVRIGPSWRHSVGVMAGNPHKRADLPRAVRERRRQLGLRQEDLADLAGVSLRFVQALEGGKPTVQLDRVTAVLDTLGLRLVVERGKR